MTSEVQQVYDFLWAEAAASFAGGKVHVDPYLAGHRPDRRQGITLIARPDARLAARLREWLEQLKRQEPDQYYYDPADFHITVLTLISCSEHFSLDQISPAAYDAVFSDLLPRRRPITTHFRGITASAGAVMAQGYVDNDDLNTLRADLRLALGRVGLAGPLDQRYKIVTAHITLARFCAPLRHGPDFLALLQAARRYDFGACRFDRLDFVVNDWYMSKDKVQVLASYKLNLGSKEDE